VFFVAVGVILAAQSSSAQTIVAVGNCRPHLVSYSTISEAVASVTPNSTVLVCPGTYPEQVTITQPLILKGLTSVIGTRMVLVQGISVQGTGPVDISNVVVGENGVPVAASFMQPPSEL
jgi:pectin methylesterase-like acyl-CoA thioesterase